MQQTWNTLHPNLQLVWGSNMYKHCRYFKWRHLAWFRKVLRTWKDNPNFVDYIRQIIIRIINKKRIYWTNFQDFVELCCNRGGRLFWNWFLTTLDGFPQAFGMLKKMYFWITGKKLYYSEKFPFIIFFPFLSTLWLMLLDLLGKVFSFVSWLYQYIIHSAPMNCFWWNKNQTQSYFLNHFTESERV